MLPPLQHFPPVEVPDWAFLARRLGLAALVTVTGLYILATALVWLSDRRSKPQGQCRNLEQ